MENASEPKPRRQAVQTPPPRQGDAAGRCPRPRCCGWRIRRVRSSKVTSRTRCRTWCCTARVVRYRRERWLTPEGETIVAPLPERHPRPFWARAAPLRADAVSPGPGDGRAPGHAAAGDRHQHLQAPGHAPADRRAGRLPDGDPRGAARRPGNGRLDHRGRHRCAPSRRQRRLHADRQRQLRLVRHDGQQEPPELPRPAARRSHRLCDQRRGPGLHARTCAGRNAGPATGHAQAAAVCR